MPTQTKPPDLADNDLLAAGLKSVFGLPVEILSREPNVHTSTFPSEIVKCRTASGTLVDLFCKWGTRAEDSFGHKAGVPYEAAVYARILEPLALSTPRFHGGHPMDSQAGQTLLVLEHLNDPIRVNRASGPSAMPEAARWIGEFHKAAELLTHRESSAFLNRYDADYYRGWIERTVAFAGHIGRRFSWFEALVRKTDSIVDQLLALPPTIIHGEYTPMNILVCGGRIRPVDWESAAVAGGQIDLAMLVDRWPRETADACERVYRKVRGFQGPASDAQKQWALARAYVQFRWMGERAEWTRPAACAERFAALKDAAECAGLL